MKKRTKKTNNFKPLIILIAILIILIFAAIYYFLNANKLERRSNLVGDKVCSSFPDEKGQDNCCFNFHKEDITIKCVGNWKYIEGIDKCQFVCENSLPSCPEDAKQCSGSKVVKRNPDLECNFDYC